MCRIFHTICTQCIAICTGVQLQWGWGWTVDMLDDLNTPMPILLILISGKDVTLPFYSSPSTTTCTYTLCAIAWTIASASWCQAISTHRSCMWGLDLTGEAVEGVDNAVLIVVTPQKLPVWSSVLFRCQFCIMLPSVFMYWGNNQLPVRSTYIFDNNQKALPVQPFCMVKAPCALPARKVWHCEG